jgi:predicted  nucleic acid-binding Zn-ribbon protein
MNIIEKLFKLQTAELSKKSSDSDLTQLRSELPEPILAHYDRFMARGKSGVAIVRNQVCSGCHMRIPIGTLNTLLHNLDIQLCANCGRYLYLPPAETSTQQTVPPKRARRRREALGAR